MHKYWLPSRLRQLEVYSGVQSIRPTSVVRAAIGKQAQTTLSSQAGVRQDVVQHVVCSLSCLLTDVSQINVAIMYSNVESWAPLQRRLAHACTQHTHRLLLHTSVACANNLRIRKV